MLDNFRPNCPASDHVEFATGQLFMNFTGGNQISNGGNNINENSMLFLSGLTKPGCKITLDERQFVSVPFLGRGPSRPIEESKLQQGSYSGDKKSCKNLTEKTLKINQDLVPSLKSSIQNPANLCESVAADGWIRGGLPSRELSRDKDYFSKCN